MKPIWIILHGLVLAVINIGAILFGFMVYVLVRPANQIAVQAPIAIVASIVATLVWAWISRRFAAPSKASLPWVFLIALIWLPAIFIPLHYLTQGYLADFDNVLWGWAFQAPVNAIALLLVQLIWMQGHLPKPRRRGGFWSTLN